MIRTMLVYYSSVISLVISASSSVAGENVSLFEAVSDAMPAPGAGVIAEYLVAIDARALRTADIIELNVPGYTNGIGEHHVAERDDFELRTGGGFRWYGRINAMNDILITSDGALANIHIGGTDGRWFVRPMGNGGHLLVKIDPDFSIPPDQTVLPPDPPPSPEALKASSEELEKIELSRSEEDLLPPEGISHIDVMVLYTAEALNAAEGHAQIRNFAQSQIDLSNQIFANSQVSTVRYRLRHVAFSAIPDGLSSLQTLVALLNRPGLAQMRSAYGADTVILLNGFYSDFFAGIASIQRNPGPSFAPNAVGSVVINYAFGSYVFAHEAGHILGMEHNPEDAGGTPQTASFPWSFGHRTPLSSPAPPDPGFVTVMSYFGDGGFVGRLAFGYHIFLTRISF